MPDRPIIGNDARQYLKHVDKHGLHADTEWLIDVGRFPVGCRVLDVGCGTGTLVRALAGDKQFFRSVIGVELSPELAGHASIVAQEAGGTVDLADILTWNPPAGWQPDTVVMSYFLHHCDDTLQHLRRVAELLPHGGRLYVLDRIARDQTAMEGFPRYWREHYHDAHEWEEELPQLDTIQGLCDAANCAGFDFVRQEICPHDHRIGTEGFPKTLMEFWRHEPTRMFPPVLVVSPAHQEFVDEICDQLAVGGLFIEQRLSVFYSDDVIRTLYEYCPWREPLLSFVGEVCAQRVATALLVRGDYTTPSVLNRLSRFKKTHRDLWKSICGPTDANGLRAIILPFHVAEPYESESLARVVGIALQGR